MTRIPSSSIPAASLTGLVARSVSEWERFGFLVCAWRNRGMTLEVYAGLMRPELPLFTVDVLAATAADSAAGEL